MSGLSSRLFSTSGLLVSFALAVSASTARDGNRPPRREPTSEEVIDAVHKATGITLTVLGRFDTDLMESKWVVLGPPETETGNVGNFAVTVHFNPDAARRERALPLNGREMEWHFQEPDEFAREPMWTFSKTYDNVRFKWFTPEKRLDERWGQIDAALESLVARH